MQLERVRIQNYKCLRDVDAAFRTPVQERGSFSAQLLAGVNGSGKSCFLEALGLIFTRVMQGEVPGFPFELQYRIGPEQTQVSVRPAGRRGKKLEVAVTQEGWREELDRIPEKLLPHRIVACSSGVNHLMDSVLLSSPRASLASDLYDLVLQGAPEYETEMSQLLDQYQALDTNPRIFSIDEETAKLVAPVLFAVIPGFRDPDTARDYFDLRRDLVRRISRRFTPIAFSLTVDETRLQTLVEEQVNSPQYGLLEKLFRPGQEGADPLYSWTVRRPMLDSPGGEQMSQTAVFCYQPWPGRSRQKEMWSPELSAEFDGDPMMLLNVLAAAHRSGVLLDIQLAFQRDGQKTLLGLETLSDGELMWLARMGLVLMSRRDRSADTLFLFDEPDVHLNNSWNVDFIDTLRRYSRIGEQALRHEFVITTHSTLMLTDAYAGQIHLFSAGERGIQVETPSIIPFAAQQDELSQSLFSASSIGSYALKQVEAALQQADTPEQLQELIQETGPGYERFRLCERYYQLKKRWEQ